MHVQLFSVDDRSSLRVSRPHPITLGLVSSYLLDVTISDPPNEMWDLVHTAYGASGFFTVVNSYCLGMRCWVDWGVRRPLHDPPPQCLEVLRPSHPANTNPKRVKSFLDFFQDPLACHHRSVDISRRTCSCTRVIALLGRYCPLVSPRCLFAGLRRPTKVVLFQTPFHIECQAGATGFPTGKLEENPGT